MHGASRGQRKMAYENPHLSDLHLVNWGNGRLWLGSYLFKIPLGIGYTDFLKSESLHDIITKKKTAWSVFKTWKSNYN